MRHWLSGATSRGTPFTEAASAVAWLLRAEPPGPALSEGTQGSAEVMLEKSLGPGVAVTGGGCERQER